MKIGPDVAPNSAISGSNPETIIIRGFDLANELMGHVSFTDHFWLLLTGTRATPLQQRILDATLVAIAEHGLVPSVVASRMTLAAAPEAMQGAVAAGILGCGSVILGSAQSAGEFFEEIRQTDGASVEEAVASVVGRYRAARRAIPGYGHPLHKGGDPRAVRLFRIAEEQGAFGAYSKIAHEVERLLPGLVNRPLAMNISAAIPAVLLDAGYPLAALQGVPLLARTASLIAHLLEERSRPIGFLLAQSGSSAIAYDGPSPAGFVAQED